MRAVHGGCWVTTEVVEDPGGLHPARQLDSARRPPAQLRRYDLPRAPASSEFFSARNLPCVLRRLFPGFAPASRKSPSLHPFQTDSRARRLSEFPLSLFTTSAESVYLSRGDPTPRYVPSLAFHPPSTVFSAPEPRGLVSSHSRVQGSPFRGLTSSVKQYRVILGQCPLAVRDATQRPKPLRLAIRLRLWSKPRRKSRSRLQGFALYTGYDGDRLAVKPDSSSCPSWVFTPPGSGFRTVEDAFTSHPLTTLSEATRSVLILSVLPVLNLYRLEFVDHPARVL